jgi:hypothetical protein
MCRTSGTATEASMRASWRPCLLWKKAGNTTRGLLTTGTMSLLNNSGSTPVSLDLFKLHDIRRVLFWSLPCGSWMSPYSSTDVDYYKLISGKILDWTMELPLNAAQSLCLNQPLELVGEFRGSWNFGASTIRVFKKRAVAVDIQILALSFLVYFCSRFRDSRDEMPSAACNFLRCCMKDRDINECPAVFFGSN